MKEKKCLACGIKYTPTREFQHTCDFNCTRAYERDQKAAKKKKAPKTIAVLHEAAAVLLQKLVRLKAADENGYVACFTCDTVKHWKEMQGGHFISRKWTATKLLEENVHPQCRECNGPAKRGNMIPYTLRMQDLYGREFVEELEILKHQTKKYRRDEINGIISELTARVREIEGSM